MAINGQPLRSSIGRATRCRGSRRRCSAPSSASGWNESSKLPRRLSASWREQAPLVGGCHGGRPVVDLELLVDVEQVRLDGRLADEQAGGRAAVRLALGDQREDLELAGTESVRGGRAE